MTFAEIVIETSNYPPTGPANPPALPADNPDPNEGIPGTGEDDGDDGEEGGGEPDGGDGPEGGADE